MSAESSGEVIRIDKINVYGGIVNIGGSALEHKPEPETPASLSPEELKVIANEMDAINAQRESGIDEDELAELGYKVEPTLESGVLADEEENGEPEDDLAKPEDEKEDVSKQDAINAQARQTYLIQMLKDTGKQHRRQGHTVQHDEDKEPRNRSQAEENNYQAQRDAKTTLKRACNVCVYAGSCALKNNYPLWHATHPYSGSDRKLYYHHELYPQIKIVEGRVKFLKRLRKDPLAHCIPSKSKSSER